MPLLFDCLTFKPELCFLILPFVCFFLFLSFSKFTESFWPSLLLMSSTIRLCLRLLLLPSNVFSFILPGAPGWWLGLMAPSRREDSWMLGCWGSGNMQKLNNMGLIFIQQLPQKKSLKLFIQRIIFHWTITHCYIRSTLIKAYSAEIRSK